MNSEADLPFQPPQSPHFTYKWQEEGAESLEKYRPGGFHPTHIGDYFHNGRYKIIHKLGYGGYSTVWLARDTLDDKNVALKILRADQPTRNRETEILRLLTSKKAAHKGSAFVTSLLDAFVIDGPNGKHDCLVVPVAGCSVLVAKESARGTSAKFPLSVARSIVAQVTLGLDYIHSCGIVHGGMYYLQYLHLGNILLEIPGLDKLSETEIYSYLGEPRKFPTEREDELPVGPEAPAYYVMPALMTLCGDGEVENPRIVISDFSEAFFATDEDRQWLNVPTRLMAPEAFAYFKEYLGPKTDIWTLGCTAFEILAGYWPLFADDGNQCIFAMVCHLGPLPSRWWDKWEGKDIFYNTDGSLKQVRSFMSLADHMLKMERGETAETCEFKTEEFAALEDVLNKMLTYEPADRPTTSEVLASEWMQKWAIPDISEPNAHQILSVLLERCRRVTPIFARQDKEFLEWMVARKEGKEDPFMFVPNPHPLFANGSPQASPKVTNATNFQDSLIPPSGNTQAGEGQRPNSNFATHYPNSNYATHYTDRDGNLQPMWWLTPENHVDTTPEGHQHGSAEVVVDQDKSRSEKPPC